MKPVYHVAVSAGLSAGVYLYLRSWPAALGCFLSGILIDVDHHLDCYLSTKKFPLRYKDLAHFCATNVTGGLYLAFHSYELLLAFWGVIYFFQLDILWLGMAMGLTVHLLCDQFTNPLKPLSYFLLYRVKHGFSREALHVDGHFEKNLP